MDGAKTIARRVKIDLCMAAPMRMNPARSLFARGGPDDALLFFGDRRHFLVYKFLDALAAISYCGEDVSVRIRGDAVHGVDLSRIRKATSSPQKLIAASASRNLFTREW